MCASSGGVLVTDKFSLRDSSPKSASLWTHAYGAIADTITSASIQIGIAQHESASPGSQLALFDLEGNDLTATLDALFEGFGGALNEYNVYSFALPGSTFASLLDGTAMFTLTLQGPVEKPGLLPSFPPQIQPNNGANLIFSTLRNGNLTIGCLWRTHRCAATGTNEGVI